MKFIDFIKSKLFGKESYEISSESFDEYFEHNLDESNFRLTEIALFTTIDLIARTLAKCEFVTVKNNEEYYGAEYYLWNYKPNKHQTKVEFITQFVSTLLIKNEALIFETADGQLLVADNFSQDKYAVFEDTFSGITARGWELNKKLRSSEVIYLKYNNIALRGLLADMCSAYQNLMTAAQQRYEKATGHKGILSMNAAATGDTNFQDRLNDLLQNRFKEYFKARNAVLPMYNGFSYTEPSTDAGRTTNSEINDISKLKTEAFKTVANAFHIAPAIISGEASQLSDAETATISNAIDPLALMLEQEATAKRYGEKDFLRGNYIMIDTTYARHIDAIANANNIDKSIACGVLNPFKAQRYCHTLPSKEDWAKEYHITKNYQTAGLEAKGGDEE